MYIVRAIPPSALSNSGLDFRDGYFPRKVRYKKEAKELAKEAESKGGINVKVEKIGNPRDEVMRSIGLTKVRGCVSGQTYWE